MDANLKVFTQGHDHGNAYAVQTSRYFVALVVKLAAGVQDGHNHLHGRDFEVWMHINGNAAPIVLHLNFALVSNGNFDQVTMTGQSFVDGVVHNLIHKVMQPALAGASNIHCRTLANSFKAFQHLNVVSIVVLFYHNLLTPNVLSYIYQGLDPESKPLTT